jgi:DNA-binding NtrC family response regulator
MARIFELKSTVIQNASLLATLASGEECASLQTILNATGWSARFTTSFSDARDLLALSCFDVVLCAAQFEGGRGWKDVLHELHGIRVPPPLIVADRLADCVLWAEVLNHGCYDLLTTPFRADEVLRVIPLACEFRKRELDRVNRSPNDGGPRRFNQQPGRALAAAI